MTYTTDLTILNIMSYDLSLFSARQSCRNFKSDPVPEDVLNQILHAGTLAPTGRNLQSPILIAVTNKELRDKLSKINGEILGTSNDPFYGAPTVVIVLADKNVPTYLYDGSVVMENLMLAAAACGVNSCWIHRAKEEFERPEGKEILKQLGITGNYEGIGHCVLGYAAAPLPAPTAKKENYVYYIK